MMLRGSILIFVVMLCAAAPTTSPAVRVTLEGGRETDPRDHGRPVILIASALGVPADVFREAFTHVKPAGPGQQPEPEQVRKNKEALMNALSKSGVTNDRLDEVSNRYRYKPGKGNVWKHTDAVVHATVENGKVTGFIIDDAGDAYTTPPAVSVDGFRD